MRHKNYESVVIRSHHSAKGNPPQWRLDSDGVKMNGGRSWWGEVDSG